MRDVTQFQIDAIDRGMIPYMVDSGLHDDEFPETYYQTVDALGYDPLSKDPTR